MSTCCKRVIEDVITLYSGGGYIKIRYLEANLSTVFDVLSFAAENNRHHSLSHT